MSDQLLGLPGELTGDGRQGGEVDGHDVGGEAGVLPWPAGSVHRLSVALSVTGAVTAGKTCDPCNVLSLSLQTNKKIKYKINENIIWSVNKK